MEDCGELHGVEMTPHPLRRMVVEMARFPAVWAGARLPGIREVDVHPVLGDFKTDTVHLPVGGEAKEQGVMVIEVHAPQYRGIGLSRQASH